MRIYDKPKCLADLEKGDIVYTIYNGEITQAKVVAFKKIFQVDGYNGKVEIVDTINNTKDKWENKTSSYITFITPKGDKFTKDFYSYDQQPPYIYNSVEDLRNKPKYGHTYLDNKYSSRVCKDADVELANYIGKLKKMLPNVKINDKGEICLWRSYKGKVEELGFDLMVFDSEKEGFEIGIYHTNGDNCIWGTFSDLINKKKYFTTQKECYDYTMPKVVTFDEPKERKITHYAVYKNTYNPNVVEHELIDCHKDLDSAILQCAKLAYADKKPLADEDNEYDFYNYAVYAMYDDDEIYTDDELYRTEYYVTKLL